MKHKRINFALICLSIPAIAACTIDRSTNRTTQIETSIVGYEAEMTCVTPVYRIAPTLCIAPPSGARMSQASTGSPHGRKLYHLYVSDPAAYAAAAAGQAPAPIGLTLVKEAHYALKSTPSDRAQPSTSTTVAWVPGPISELFLMSKIGESDTPETDAGWVYSVASPQGELQTSGLIESCIKCHEQSPHDRLFGLAPATTLYFE